MVSGDLKEKDWLQQTFNSFHPKAKYKIAKWMRLTGIMLIVCVREDKCHAIRNISAQTVGTGGLGFGKILQFKIIICQGRPCPDRPRIKLEKIKFSGLLRIFET